MFDQVKQAAVEQIRCVRQTSEEACWQCGRPATETCSGNVGAGSICIYCIGIVGIGSAAGLLLQVMWPALVLLVLVLLLGPARVFSNIDFCNTVKAKYIL